MWTSEYSTKNSKKNTNRAYIPCLINVNYYKGPSSYINRFERLGLLTISLVKRDLTIYKILVTFGEVANFLSQITFNFKNIFFLYMQKLILFLSKSYNSRERNGFDKII